ncbi:MAG: Asp-tRNA(Asn)/Glu-tRNA(Gln) amidotransferase subunit GatC [Nitrospinae bacterium]|nr:Asp-tRNA(Asn)/Glu-tRNA(Gln) amidotransferase subunit GatC [Nitrospinota bacterium]
MKITKEKVKHIAMLARLEIDEEEEERFAQQLSDVLNHMEKLDQLDTEDVEPTSHILPIQNVFKEDEIKDIFPMTDPLSSAPQKEYGHYRVPKVVE